MSFTFEAHHKFGFFQSSPSTTDPVIPEPASSLNSTQSPFNPRPPNSSSYNNLSVLLPDVQAYFTENTADWPSYFVDSDEIPLSPSDSANLATVTDKLATCVKK